MGVEIALTPAEITSAALLGVMRQVENIQKNRQPNWGDGGKAPWQLHIEGALGEYAVAKYLDVFWNGNLGNLEAADVGEKQVRTTTIPIGRLIVHENESDNDIFILVTGQDGKYTIQGWVWGSQAKKPEYWEDPTHGNRPAFFVPISALAPIETLKRAPAPPIQAP